MSREAAPITSSSNKTEQRRRSSTCISPKQWSRPTKQPSVTRWQGSKRSYEWHSRKSRYSISYSEQSRAQFNRILLITQRECKDPAAKCDIQPLLNPLSFVHSAGVLCGGEADRKSAQLWYCCMNCITYHQQHPFFYFLPLITLPAFGLSPWNSSKFAVLSLMLPSYLWSPSLPSWLLCSPFLMLSI